jgi:hypothetical protein
VRRHSRRRSRPLPSDVTARPTPASRQPGPGAPGRPAVPRTRAQGAGSRGGAVGKTARDRRLLPLGLLVLVAGGTHSRWSRRRPCPPVTRRGPVALARSVAGPGDTCPASLRAHLHRWMPTTITLPPPTLVALRSEHTCIRLAGLRRTPAGQGRRGRWPRPGRAWALRPRARPRSTVVRPCRCARRWSTTQHGSPCSPARGTSRR